MFQQVFFLFHVHHCFVAITLFQRVSFDSKSQVKCYLVDIKVRRLIAHIGLEVFVFHVVVQHMGHLLHLLEGYCQVFLVKQRC